MTQEVAGLRAERARLRRSVCDQIREGMVCLDGLRLALIAGQSATLSFGWASLSADLQRLGALDRRLGRIEEPLSEEQADGL